MISIKNSPFFCSWSGGKDSCLALYRAIQQGGQPRALLTMLIENGERSRSHGIPIDLLKKQALALGIPLVTRATSWDNYESTFISAITELKKEGVEAGVFGDIDIDAHREWSRQVCSVATIKSYHPLWQESRYTLLHELIEAGFKAIIIVVKNGILDKQFLGKIIHSDTLREIEKIGIDVSGERGEYHTVVTDGPIFSIHLKPIFKEPILRDGCWFLETRIF